MIGDRELKKSDECVARYLKDTVNFREIYEEIKRTSSASTGEFHEKVYRLSPWLYSQVMLNCGITNELEIDEFVNKNASIFEESIGLEHGDRKLILREDASLEELKPTGLQVPGVRTIKVKTAFNWYLFLIVRRLAENKESFVKIPEAIFDLKNGLFLPDDFMPKVMMNLVEGDEPVDIARSLHEIQPLEDFNLIHILGLCEGNKCDAAYAFIATEIPQLENTLPSLEDLKNIIINSFEEVKKSDGYNDFTLSRILRSLIFNVEAKKTRELKKPLFDESKINVLEKLGLIERSGDKTMLSNNVDVDYLKMMERESKKKGSILSEEWMNSPLVVS